MTVQSARRDAMVQHYLNGHTLHETGEQFGITRERVRQVLTMRGIHQPH